jgi:hypothetical protein
MRGVAGLSRWGPVFSTITLAGLLLSGCKTVEGGPDRLYSVPEEVAQARGLLDSGGPQGVQGLVARYYNVNPNDPSTDAQRMYFRNEIIARRMYIIDVEYSDYEASLTSERQKFGFLTTAAASALGIAATLTSPLQSAQIVSGAGAAALASRGAYDSEVVIAKTLQIVQGYMRASRDIVASRQILPRLTESSVTYPLSAALHGLEDYYRAGTFTAGLIPALQDSGTAAQSAANEKAILISYGSTDTTKALGLCINKASTAKLVALVTPSTPVRLAQIRFDGSIQGEAERRLLLVRAKAAGLCP